jgi:hypothetical protein
LLLLLLRLRRLLWRTGVHSGCPCGVPSGTLRLLLLLHLWVRLKALPVLGC